MTEHTRPTWPKIRIDVDDLGSVHLFVAGVHRQNVIPSRTARQQAMDAVVDLARRYARPLDVDATDEHGTFHMTVHPDGHIDENAYTPRSDSAGTTSAQGA
ncbi:hypothetical protein HD592_002018 [Schaalia hyovaginalis]|uniref:Uncharacterized protein n=2 Tax=Schaalia hyovaginalis TaxID=29316 RepID=A0A923IYF5_9ACTO|nr:hypothetical protein [Schaalia hyovaginalis]